MLNRNLNGLIIENITKYPILALIGPRQSGKTTLLKLLFNDYKYVNLENPDMMDYAVNDTRGFLAEYSDKVIFDEAQKFPKLFSYLQSIVDESGKMGQFILSGSQNFLLMDNITQSLAGRVTILTLYPFDLIEMNAAGWLDNNLTSVMSKGFYPALHLRNVSPDRYYSDYYTTYVKRDVTQLVNIQNERAFTTFVRLCAGRAGSLLNLSSLARDTGISHSTAQNWLSLLETSYVIFLLPPYYKNYNKRLIKSPKLYFNDVGLLVHLLGYRKGSIEPSDKVWGHVFENMVVAEMIKQNSHLDLGREYWFWRDSHGHEIDLLYTESGRMHTIEIKASTTITSKFFDGLAYFANIVDEEISSQTVIYGGQTTQTRTNYTITPWREIMPKAYTI